MAFRSGIYDTVSTGAEGLPAAEGRQIRAAMLTASAQQCGMAKTGEAIAVHLEDANGR
jgi:hypothetical protein